MQSLEGVVPGGDEGAVNPQFAGDFEVVQRVPHEENSGGSDREASDEFVAEGEFAVGVDISESGDVVEVCGEAEMLDDFVQRFLPVRERIDWRSPAAEAAARTRRAAGCKELSRRRAS